MAYNFLQMEQVVPGDNPAEAWMDWRKKYELFKLHSNIITAYECNIKDHTIQGVCDDVLCERLLRVPKLSLKNYGNKQIC